MSEDNFFLNGVDGNYRVTCDLNSVLFGDGGAHLVVLRAYTQELLLTRSNLEKP